MTELEKRKWYKKLTKYTILYVFSCLFLMFSMLIPIPILGLFGLALINLYFFLMFLSTLILTEKFTDIFENNIKYGFELILKYLKIKK